MLPAMIAGAAKPAESLLLGESVVSFEREKISMGVHQSETIAHVIDIEDFTATKVDAELENGWHQHATGQQRQFEPCLLDSVICEIKLPSQSTAPLLSSPFLSRGYDNSDGARAIGLAAAAK